MMVGHDFISRGGLLPSMTDLSEFSSNTDLKFLLILITVFFLKKRSF